MIKIIITGGSGFIGTNLIDKLVQSRKFVIFNIDIARPKKEEHLRYWINMDIMDREKLMGFFGESLPSIVVHLAARTDTDPENTLEDYRVNTQGSENLISAVRDTSTVKHVIFTSTQFVHQYQGFPKSDTEFAPHTVYGESKMIMEKSIRAAQLNCVWTIVRPTNIWGPWHLRYPYEFWDVLSKGYYIHPGNEPVIRSYGYVGNVVQQLITILELPNDIVGGKVFYVGDKPIDLFEWTNGFSIEQTGKQVRVVPRFIIRIIALLGDALSLIRIRFPITTSRYKSMTTSNIAPMDFTFEILGLPKYSLSDGIKETVQWMKIYFPHLVKNMTLKDK